GQRNSAGITGDDPEDAPLPTDLPFGSRQRGSSTINPKNVFWNPLHSTPPPDVQQAAIPVAMFDYKMTQSMGFVNQPWGQRWTGAPASLSAYSSDAQPTVGQTLFPWLTWNNRPFTSEAELLLVPCETQEQMLRHFGAPTIDPLGTATSYRYNLRN